MLVYTLYLLNLVMYVSSLYLYLKHRRVGVWMGANVGINYLILLPFSVVLIQGGMAVDDDGITYRSGIDITRDQLEIATILIATLIYGAWDLFTHRLYRQKELIPTSKPSPTRPVLAIWQILLAVITLYVTIFVLAGLHTGEGHWARSLPGFIERYGVLGNLAMVGRKALRVVVLVGLTCLYLRERITLSLMLSTLAILCMADLYLTGTRIFTLQAMLIVGIALLYTRRYKIIACIGVAVIPFGFFMTLWGAIRSQMHQYQGGGFRAVVYAFLDGWEFATKRFLSAGYGISDFILGITEGSSLLTFVTVLKIVPAQMEYLYGSSLIKPLVIWVPRSVWPNKPLSAQAIVGEYIAPGTGLSVTMSTFGEFYLNFGLPGMLLVPLAFALMSWLLSKIVKDPMALSLLLFVAGFTAVRMSYANVFVAVTASAIVLRYCKLGQESDQTELTSTPPKRARQVV